MHHLGMLSDHIGQWNAPHSLYVIGVKYYCFYGFHPIICVYFGQLKVICHSIFLLPLVLKFEVFSLGDMTNVMRLEQCSIDLNENKQKMLEEVLSCQ